MGLIDRITDILIERRMRMERIDVVNPDLNDGSAAFKRVLNTLRENKVMVATKDDGIYVRMAGNESDGQAFTLEWGKVYSFDEGSRNRVPEKFKQIR